MYVMLPSRWARAYRRLRAFAARATNGFPDKKLILVGVTGTDGKTTTVNLVGHILRAAGKRVGWVSTLGAQIGDEFIETGAHNTTVDPFPFYRLLAKMVRARCELAVVELTSHALDQDRLGTMPLAAGIVTNIAHEHLDYHRRYEDYLAAKAKISSLVAKGRRNHGGTGTVVLNCEDRSFDQLRAYHRFTGVTVRTFGIGHGDIRGERLEESLDGMTLTVITDYGHHTVRTKLLGDYNIRNILGAAMIAHVIGISWEKIHEGIETFQPLSGRLEPVACGQPFTVLVDFAHTPQALTEVLTLLKRLAQGKIIVVFGAAGERDSSKRPAMGEAVGRLADAAFVTEEDPRSESVEAISRQIEEGLKSAGKREGEGYWLVADRREAIARALRLAHAGDIVLLAGKGHETMMAMDHGEDKPWDDRIVAREELETLGWRR